MPFTGKQFDELIAAIRLIAEGTVHSPSGLEGLGISIAGDGLEEPLGPAVRETFGELTERICESVQAVANALEEVAEAIHMHGETVASRAPGAEPSPFVVRALAREARRVKAELEHDQRPEFQVLELERAFGTDEPTPTPTPESD